MAGRHCERRRINGQFDARVAEMQQILAEADQRIAELRSLIDESRRLAEPASEVSSRRPQSERPADQTHAPVVPPSPETLEAARSPKGPPSVQAASPPSPAVDPRGRIYAFADEGLTPVQIAQRTGRPVGEVELILNLRRAVAAEPGRKP